MGRNKGARKGVKQWTTYERCSWYDQSGWPGQGMSPINKRHSGSVKRSEYYVRYYVRSKLDTITNHKCRWLAGWLGATNERVKKYELIGDWLGGWHSYLMEWTEERVFVVCNTYWLWRSWMENDGMDMWRTIRLAGLNRIESRVKQKTGRKDGFLLFLE